MAMKHLLGNPIPVLALLSVSVTAPGLSQNSPLQLGHVAFGEERYDDALEHYRTTLRSGNRWAWLVEMIETVEHRRTLGTVRPEHVQQVCFIYLTAIDRVDGRGRTNREEDVTEDQREQWFVWRNVMRQVIESFSDGAMSLEFSDQDAVSTYPEDSHLKPTNPDHLNLERYFLESAAECDTYITVSNTVSPAMALARRYPYVNGAIYGPSRGMVAINASNHGFDTLFHEFFHTIEWISGGMGGRTHGYRDEFRGDYPEWSGETEFDYYRWHFRTTLPRIGWGHLIHRDRFKVLDDRAIENLQPVLEAYRDIPMLESRLADSLNREPNRMRSEPERANALYERIVESSPYELQALGRLADYLENEGNDSERAARYRERIELVKTFNGFYSVDEETEMLGTVIGVWGPEDMARTGRVIEFRAGGAVSGPGEYEVTFDYTDGWNALTLNWVAIYKDGKEVDRDTHDGWTGRDDRDNKYVLVLSQWEEGSDYLVRALVNTEGGTDSNGIVAVRRR